MPPKKKEQPNKKTIEKQKEKIIEDKTFGLKNKKGAKQQKFVKHVEQQVRSAGQKSSRAPDPAAERASKKEEERKRQEELNLLFKPAIETQKVARGVDPKSVLCAFYKLGQCKKGDKCKFSHDLTVERKTEKRNIYDDVRDEDTIDGWDDTKLASVVDQKHGKSNKAAHKTEIICKHFLDAVENSKYGWFWECPNGDRCIYRHAIPPGFVLKKDMKKADKAEEISIEDLIERERAALGGDLTRVTLETFLAWKERKRKEKVQNARQRRDEKRQNFSAGRTVGISGREMFEFNPDFVAADDDDAGADVYKREEEDEADGESGPVFDISDEMFSSAPALVAGTASQITATTVTTPTTTTTTTTTTPQQNGLADTRLAALSPVDTAVEGATGGGGGGAVPIDEDLFADMDELQDIEDELESLEVGS